MQIEEPVLHEINPALWWAALVVVVAVALLALFFWYKGRRLPGEHVFRASRFSRGNLFFPTQVAISQTSVLHFTPEVVGGREQSIHMAHIASVLIDRNLFFSDVMIETSGGASPVRCHGHRKRDAVAMKQLIERFQSEYYGRGQRDERTSPQAQPKPDDRRADRFGSDRAS